MKDSLGRETDHRTPCDEGQHSRCTDAGCDCNCHSALMQAIARVPEVLAGLDRDDEERRTGFRHRMAGE